MNNALEVLLNVENYESIAECSVFQQNTLPGFQVAYD